MNKLAALLIATCLISPAFAQEAGKDVKKEDVQKVEVKKVKKGSCCTLKPKAAPAPAEKKALAVEETKPEAPAKTEKAKPHCGVKHGHCPKPKPGPVAAPASK